MLAAAVAAAILPLAGAHPARADQAETDARIRELSAQVEALRKEVEALRAAPAIGIKAAVVHSGGFAEALDVLKELKESINITNEFISRQLSEFRSGTGEKG